DLAASGFQSASTVHLVAESMRRAYADRTRYLGDPAFNPDMPIDRLTSKAHAAELRRSIDPARAATSSPATFQWHNEGNETTHISVVDAGRNAVALTYTLEYGYGSPLLVPRPRFLLNNQMGHLHPRPHPTQPP